MNRPSLVFAASLAACQSEAPPERDLCEVPGNICTWAGVPNRAEFGADDVPATQSPLYLPMDVTFAPDGTAYLPDFNNHRIRRIDTDGIVRTVSGTGFLGDGPEGDSGAFAWNHPAGIAVDPMNPSVLHVAAFQNSRLSRVDGARGITEFACGTGQVGYAGDGGPAMDAHLAYPSSIAFDSRGDMYFSDVANQMIRRVGRDGVVEAVAGTPGVQGYAGDGGPATEALLHSDVGRSTDPSSRIVVYTNLLYLADTANNTVRVIDLDTMTIDRVAGIQWAWSDDPSAPDASEQGGGDGGPALDAYLNHPSDIAVGAFGELYIADTDNNCVRVVAPDGRIDTFAGTCGAVAEWGESIGEEEPARDALLNRPYGVATDLEGNLYIADTDNHVIRRVKRDPNGVL